MKDEENIREIAALQPDFMGFIFYKRSPRFSQNFPQETILSLPDSIKKIGVFVNENLETILTYADRYRLDGVQLHGAENEALCAKLKKETDLLIIKAFSIMTANNFKATTKYENICDLFLFDTKSDVYGGSGLQFDWTILKAYQGDKTFLLSGGIAIEDWKKIEKIKHPKMIGVDINSRFETKPGYKNATLVKRFINEFTSK